MVRRGTVVNVIRALRRDLDVGLGALAAVAWRGAGVHPRRAGHRAYMYV